MSPQDSVERILKEIHVMFSKCETYENKPDKVIIDRKEFLGLLDRLNQGIFTMMEAYEQTRQSRDRAERTFRHKGQEMIDEASKQADDIYAASVIYTADMLGKVQELIDQTNESMNDAFRLFKKELRGQKELVKTHENELEGQLHNMADEGLYRGMIEQVRREQRKQQRDAKAEREAQPAYPDRPVNAPVYTPPQAVDVKINADYFEKSGISPEDAKAGFVPTETAAPVEKPDIKINYDSPYFKQKAENQSRESNREADTRTQNPEDAGAHIDAAEQNSAVVQEHVETEEKDARKQDSVSQDSVRQETILSDQERQTELTEEEIMAAVLEDERQMEFSNEEKRKVPDWKQRLKDLLT